MKLSQDSTFVRVACINDVKSLTELESLCFQSDRISSRSFKRHIQSPGSDLLVVCDAGAIIQPAIIAYALCLIHKGTRLARLYSLAVHPNARGAGLASRLLSCLESNALQHGKFYMRLEVAKANQFAIRLYESLGYHAFGEYYDYYEDHQNALRMQKRIRSFDQSIIQRDTPWYQQTTEFTCGPAALMMAMASLDSNYVCDQIQEISIWREATTVFMTAGHGGCHPLGLAIAAKKRGFQASVRLNTRTALFIDGVRSTQKKEIMTLVHEQFVVECLQNEIEIAYDDVSQSQLQDWLLQGFAVLILMSTYRLDGKKAPHWVTVTGIDDLCLYVHDPDLGENQLSIDCQHVPIAREDMEKMSMFGRHRIRMVIAIEKCLN